MGLLARELFPGGRDASPPDHFQYAGSVRQTQEWIEAGETVIYEAAFQHDRVLAALDILVRHRGRWYGYEVKSSTEVKDYQVNDAALQWHVITGAGLPLQDISIIHINKDYLRRGKLNLSRLFTITSVKKQVLALQPEIPGRIHALKALLLREREPDVDIGPHCSDPFDCEFMGHCWKHVSSPSVFDLVRLPATKKFDLYYQGILRYEDLPDGYRLTATQQLQVRTHLADTPHVEPEKIRDWLRGLKYPLYFMDFETFMPAVPLYERSRPYQHIPFQFSLHRVEMPGAGPTHVSFLGTPETDPRPEFIRRLLKAVGTRGSVLVYNKAFEATRLRELQALYPDLKDPIESLLALLADLMEPFQNRWYYLPSMNGSYSIKDVLPALVPELSYDHLEIGEGGTAMAAFEGLLKITDKNQQERIRRSLEEYCRLDTLAMIKILAEVIRIS